MTNKRAKHREFFSVEEANAMLPLIHAIVSDLAELSADLNDRRNRLSFLFAGRNPNDQDIYHQELVQVEQELEKDARRLHDYREELRALGVEADNGSEGFVDFPAYLEGRKVFLCWKLGEEEVLCWHDEHAGCSQRQFLTANSVVGDAPNAEENS